MKVSIIVACWARPDLTRVCIDSILKYTNVHFQLICVQEGDNEEMKTLLKSYSSLLQPYQQITEDGHIQMSDTSQLLVKYVQNNPAKGYAGALNAGLAVASKDSTHYCFMNNDTVVTPGWMEEMLKAFDDKSKEVGLVSPTFWGTGDRQSVDWNTTGDIFDYPADPCSIIGVCYLISKECLDKVGTWDESFGHGGEDFDLTIRVQNAGYMLCVARRSFIYHYGGASTRIVIGTNLEAVRANQVAKIRMVEQKHGIDIMSRFNQNINERQNTKNAN